MAGPLVYVTKHWKIGSLDESCINFSLLTTLWVFEEHRQCTYLVFEILSPLYWRMWIGSLKRQMWPHSSFKYVIFVISARLRGFIKFSNLTHDSISLNLSLWIQHTHYYWLNLILFRFVSVISFNTLDTCLIIVIIVQWHIPHCF